MNRTMHRWQVQIQDATARLRPAANKVTEVWPLPEQKGEAA